jgi:hypothetical protein
VCEAGKVLSTNVEPVRKRREKHQLFINIMGWVYLVAEQEET